MLVLRGGRVLDPSSGRDEIADLVVERGVITRIGRGAGEGITGAEGPTSGSSGGGPRVVDVTGSWVVPGLVDLHVHLREPGQEYKEDLATGLAAAAAGGFTAVCAMPNTRPVNDNRALTEHLVSRAKSVRGARLFPIGAITKGSLGAELTEMGDLRAAGAVGVSDDGKCVMNAAVMRHAMEYARTFDLLVSQHCEDHHLTEGAQMHEGAISTRLGLRGWPRAAEDIIVARDLILAELTGARYHVAHISSLGAVRLLREAKSRGLQVSAEVTPHHLTLTDAAVLGYKTACKVNPPLRSDEDRAALRDALRDGTIDCVATDHAPHNENDKSGEFSNAALGINGLETAAPVLLSLVREGVLSPLRFVEVLSTAPARILREREMGGIKIGARADITVLDPARKWKVSAGALRSRSHNTPLLDHEVTGAVMMTLVAGEIVHERTEVAR